MCVPIIMNYFIRPSSKKFILVRSSPLSGIENYKFDGLKNILFVWSIIHFILRIYWLKWMIECTFS